MFYRNISNFLLPLVSQRTASRSKRGRSQLDNKRLWPLFTDSVELEDQEFEYIMKT